MIEELTLALYGSAPRRREHYVFSQALFGLVRLAKAEHMLEVRMDARRALGLPAGTSGRRQARGVLRKLGVHCNTRQGQLQFDKD